MSGGEIQSDPVEAPHSRSEGFQSEENNASNSWVILPKKFQPEQFKEPSPCVCIYRVPELFLRCKPEDYHPQFVSFGPFHDNKHETLSATEQHKLEALNRTLKRIRNKSIHDLLRVIKSSEKKIRDYYQDSAIEYDSETLARMMMMDGCFILEFLRVVYNGEGNGQPFSLIFKSSNVENTIQSGILNDILKLENQIPLCILISILNLEVDDAQSKLRDILHSCLVFRCFPFSGKATTEEEKGDSEEKSKLLCKRACEGASHLLDLCRKMITDFLTQSKPDMMALPDQVYEIPRAELLDNAGIQFKTSVEGNFRFEKRTWGSSILFLPQILIDETTEPILRNIIIFEEYEKLKDKNNVISHYIRFMNKLIDSEKDVALLTKEEIIINFLGSDKEVANLFNNLDKGMVMGGMKQFVEVGDQIKAEYNKKLKVLMSQFIEEHCSKPWYIVSLVAAILILGITAVQTVFPVKNS